MKGPWVTCYTSLHVLPGVHTPVLTTHRAPARMASMPVRWHRALLATAGCSARRWRQRQLHRWEWGEGEGDGRGRGEEGETAAAVQVGMGRGREMDPLSGIKIEPKQPLYP